MKTVQRTDLGEVVLEAHKISKNYGVTEALKSVDFEVREGRVTVLFGENGAGKSTLMKILSGVEQPSSGKMILNGEPIVLTSTSDAVNKGIAIIHQELNLCPNLSVQDNVFLGREIFRATRGIDFREEKNQTSLLMERLEEQINPSTLVANLRIGQQQIVEIARALASNARILIMDEPTSALSAAEVVVLFKIIRELKAQNVAIVYISHHLEEALEIADFAVVFRDGELVANALASEIDLKWVVSKMVGRDAEYDFRNSERDFGEVVLDINQVSVISPEDPDRFAVKNVSIQVRAGEIVSVYGLMGAGRSELMEALAGKNSIAQGFITVNGTDIKDKNVRERIAFGIGLVPEDRQRDGLVQLMSVGSNLTLSSLKKFVKRFIVSKSTETSAAELEIQNVNVKTSGVGALITSLSGGNQQKVVIGKVLMTTPKALLLDEPTRGIDVGAKGEIFSLLFKQAEAGLAVLYVTSEVGEALSASHRILVMNKGRIVREFDPRTAIREEVMAASGETTKDGHHHRIDQNGALSAK